MSAIKTIMIILFVFIPSLVTANGKLEGWETTKWGMTQDEVKELFPDMIVSSQEKEQEKIIVPFIIENIIVEGISCKARFLFDKNKNKLQSVILHAPYAKIDEELFKKFFNKLVSKYGNPTSNLNKETGGFRRINEIWELDKTRILLIFVTDRNRQAMGLAVKYSDISIMED